LLSGIGLVISILFFIFLFDIIITILSPWTW
jgi:hypothetical protein